MSSTKINTYLAKLFLAMGLVHLSLNAFATQIISSQDISLQFSDSQKSQSVKKGEAFQFSSNEPALATSDGRIPVLLVPVTTHSEVQLNLSPVSEARCEVNSAENKVSLNQLTIRIFEIQKKISENNLAEAKAELTQLKAQFPNLSALDFLSASLALLDGRRTDAISMVQSGLKGNPDYKDGQELLNVLQSSKGGSK